MGLAIVRPFVLFAYALVSRSLLGIKSCRCHHPMAKLSITILSFMSAAAIALAAANTPPTITVPASSGDNLARHQAILTLHPGEARCANGTLDISGIETPLPQFVWGLDQTDDKSITYNFRVDDTGRAFGITRSMASAANYQFSDIGPSLAASQFVARLARSECSITYTVKRSKIADADRDALIQYSVFANGRPPEEVFKRLSPAGSTCFEQRPSVLVRAFPDFSKVPSAAAQLNWSMVQFDIDADGKPISIGTHATSGSSALDKAAIEAVSESRFGKAAKKGCLYPYWQQGRTLAAPIGPETESYRKDGATCPVDIDWESKPVSIYPDSFRRRGIDGWAIISFDVAPWGATGNINVVAAEPSSEFGDAATNLIRSAKVAVSGQGYGNCFEHVRYAMQGSRNEESESSRPGG